MGPANTFTLTGGRFFPAEQTLHWQTDRADLHCRIGDLVVEASYHHSFFEGKAVTERERGHLPAHLRCYWRLPRFSWYGQTLQRSLSTFNFPVLPILPMRFPTVSRISILEPSQGFRHSCCTRAQRQCQSRRLIVHSRRTSLPTQRMQNSLRVSHYGY